MSINLYKTFLKIYCSECNKEEGSLFYKRSDGWERISTAQLPSLFNHIAENV